MTAAVGAAGASLLMSGCRDDEQTSGRIDVASLPKLHRGGMASDDFAVLRVLWRKPIFVGLRERS